MVVGSKGWAERRYIREVKDVQGTSNKSQILKDIQKAFSRSNTEGWTQCLQSQRRRFYASSACRGAIPVPTVATSEVLRSECLHMSRCYSGAYSRNVGGSTLRVPVEVLFHGAYLRNVGGSTLRVGSVTYDEISRTRPHRAALRHPFVRTRTKTKHLHNAKKGL